MAPSWPMARAQPADIWYNVGALIIRVGFLFKGSIRPTIRAIVRI